MVGIELDLEAIEINIRNRENEDFGDSIWDIVQEDVTLLAKDPGGIN